MNEDALKARVQVAAQGLGLPFNDVFHRLVMERFLVRIAMSPHRSHFVFKGGFLLSRYVDLGRDTRDLDFLLQRLRAEKDVLTRTLNEVAALNAGDGFVFTLKAVKDLAHQHMKYPGFSAAFLVNFGKMRESLDIDIGNGDTVEAQSEALKLMTGKGKPLFEEEVSLLVYPPETILAEKLQTLVLRAEQNSRMKDYYDIFMLMRFEKCASDKAKDAISTTFKNRETSLDLLPVRFSENEIVTLQKQCFFEHYGKKTECLHTSEMSWMT
jgi:predicted nucleotidyltransferase component of viral defense system